MICPTRSPIAYVALSPDLNARRAYANYASITGPFGAQATFETSSSVVVEGKDVEGIRSQHGPHWPHGATLKGLRLALADADRNGIQVTGSALDCANWDATFDRVSAEWAKKCGCQHGGRTTPSRAVWTMGRRSMSRRRTWSGLASAHQRRSVITTTKRSEE